MGDVDAGDLLAETLRRGRDLVGIAERQQGIDQDPSVGPEISVELLGAQVASSPSSSGSGLWYGRIGLT